MVKIKNLKWKSFILPVIIVLIMIVAIVFFKTQGEIFGIQLFAAGGETYTYAQCVPEPTDCGADVNCDGFISREELGGYGQAWANKQLFNGKSVTRNGLGKVGQAWANKIIYTP